MAETFSAFVVSKLDDGTTQAQIERLGTEDLPAGDVLIRVRWSSLNYKDALAASGHGGVVRTFPHVPGIDAAGEVVESEDSRFAAGEEVIVTGYELGSGHWGGYADFIRVPGDWVVPRPEPLTLRECMIYGTAGFTAAQSVAAIVQRGIDPGRGPVLVTGATGGVGSLSVALLTKAGYRVSAVTGKADQHRTLELLGADEILSREEVRGEGNRPLLPARWSAAVDTVGGDILVDVIRSTMHRGVVTACGLVAGTDLPLTIYPFILRGVTLRGIDSAQCPRPERLEIWQRLATEWRLENLDAVVREVDLAGLSAEIANILAGRVTGRVLVRIGAS